MRSLFRLSLLSFVLLLACRPTTTVPERLELNPAELSLQFGEAKSVTASVFLGSKQTSLEGLTWTSSDDTLVAVTPGTDGTASIQGLNAGTATITVRVREAIATLTVTVAARVIVLERIELTPSTPSVAKGLRLQLQANGVYNDGSTKDLTSSVAWASADGTRATITAAGLATAVGVGDVELRARKDGITGRATMTVTAATVLGLDVRPMQVSLAKGTSQQCAATARLSDATTQDVTTQVTWASADATVASVTTGGRVSAVGVGATMLSATLGDVMGSSTVTVTSAVLRGIDVTPANVTLPLGSTRQLTVTGHYSDGTDQDVTAQATWRSGTAAVASVSMSGLVTSLGLGLSVITATVDGISGGTSVTCTAAQLTMIHVAPQGLSLARGLSRNFTATGLYTDASTRDLTASVIWSSSADPIATIDSAGLAQALTEGMATLTASNGTMTGTADLTVTPALLVSVQLTPTTATIASGLTQQVTARGTFSDGSQRDVTALLQWDSSATAVASVSSAGLVTALTPGTTTITASLGAASASMNVVVGAPRLQRLDVTAPSLSLAKGRTQQLTATGVYSDGSSSNQTANVVWAPATGAVLSVSSAGVMTAVQVGTASATATLGTVVGTLSLDVSAAVVERITVSPVAPSIPLGLGQALVARSVLSDGSTQVLTSGVTWDSATQTVATVSASGLVSSVTQGQSLITATFGTFSANTTVTVGAPVLASLAVSPTSPALDKAQTQQLTVLGTFTDNTTGPVVVTWSSGTPSVATVSSGGEVTALTPGTSVITATSGTITGTTTVTVNRPALQSLTVTPSPATVSSNGSVSFAALATYVDASTEVVTSLVTWSSSDMSVATISAAGVARGATPGLTTITAQWGATTGTADLTVTPLVLTSIVISGKTKVATGSAIQLTALATYSDATTSDVTTTATWSSDATAKMNFTNVDGVRGIAQGLAAGLATATATLGTVSATYALQVIDTNAPYVGRCATGLVISQVYGAGGNSGATWKNDFVELHNPTANAINLRNASVQYASATGNSWSNNSLTLPNVVLPAGGFYLVQLAGGTTGSPLPTADLTGTISMAAAAGKVALAGPLADGGVATITATCPTTLTNPELLDFVGFGGANCPSPTPAPSASNWVVRGANGCQNAKSNSADFTAINTVPPRSLASLSAPILCSCSANDANLTEELNACQLQSPANLGTTAGDVTPLISALITQPGVTDTAGFNANLQVQVGFGASGIDPTTTAGWRWWPAPGRTAGTTSDEYAGPFVAPTSGSWGFTARASRDGVNWTACDLNGAGSGTGLAFEMGQIGVLTVP